MYTRIFLRENTNQKRDLDRTFSAIFQLEK